MLNDLSYYAQQDGWFSTMQLPANSHFLVIICKIPYKFHMITRYLQKRLGREGHNYMMRAAVTPEGKIIIIDALGKTIIGKEALTIENFSPFVRKWRPVDGTVPACIHNESITIDFRRLITANGNPKPRQIDCKAYAITKAEFNALTAEFEKLNELYNSFDQSGLAKHLQYYRLEESKNIEENFIKLTPARNYIRFLERYRKGLEYKIKRTKQYLKSKKNNILENKPNQNINDSMQETIVMDNVNFRSTGDLKQVLKCCLYLLEMDLQCKTNNKIKLFLIGTKKLDFFMPKKDNILDAIKNHLNAIIEIYKTEFPIFAKTDCFTHFKDKILLLNEILKKTPHVDIYQLLKKRSSDRIADTIKPLRKKFLADNILKYMLYDPNEEYSRFIYSNTSGRTNQGIPRESENYKTLKEIISGASKKFLLSEANLQDETLNFIKHICATNSNLNAETISILNKVKSTIEQEEVKLFPQTLYEPHKCFDNIFEDILKGLKEYEENCWLKELSKKTSEETLQGCFAYSTQLDMNKKRFLPKHVPHQKVLQNNVLRANLTKNDCRSWVASAFDNALGKNRFDVGRRWYHSLPNKLTLNVNSKTADNIISSLEIIHPIKINPTWRIGPNHYQCQFATFLYHQLNQHNNESMKKNRELLLYYLYLPLTDNIQNIYRHETSNKKITLLTLRQLIDNFKRKNMTNNKDQQILNIIESSSYITKDIQTNGYLNAKKLFQQRLEKSVNSTDLKRIGRRLLQHTDELLTLEPSQANSLTDTISQANQLLAEPTANNKNILLKTAKSLNNHHHMAWHILGFNLTLYTGAAIAAVATLTTLNFLTLGLATPIIATAAAVTVLASTITALVFQTKQASHSTLRYKHEKTIYSIAKQLQVQVPGDRCKKEQTEHFIPSHCQPKLI